MVHLEDGHEIKFGKGDEGNSIPLPDPRICNLRLAISRVLAASGFAELIDKIFKDWKELSSEANFSDEADLSNELNRRLAFVT
jgi:hypothetical protein